VLQGHLHLGKKCIELEKQKWKLESSQDIDKKCLELDDKHCDLKNQIQEHKCRIRNLEEIREKSQRKIFHRDTQELARQKEKSILKSR
jgi:hypothetical protein